jgi:hypothetical protein
MKLWRRTKEAGSELPDFLKEGLVQFNRQLLVAADFLQEKTEGYSARKKKIFLLLFVIVFVSESLVVTIKSFRTPTKNPITVSRIKTVPFERPDHQKLLITKEEFLKIQRFKIHIDSLTSTAQGKKLKDSLLATRPELMDSVNTLINLYLEQLKTK